MTEERRRNERIPLKLHVTWEAMSGTTDANTEDISLSGCFVNTARHVEVGESLTLSIELPSSGSLTVSGLVVSYQQGIGFAMDFFPLPPEEHAKLEELLTSR
jgi:hypothetical protein